MPAVSVCDHLTVAIAHSLDTAGQSKSSDELHIGLSGSASHILRTEIEYEETDCYKSTVQERLKSKYMVLSIPKENSENISGKDASGSLKALEKTKEPTLPEPSITLYSADKVNLGWNKNFPIGAGMYNVGNTCYLNSTLQALFHVPALVNWLLSDSHHESKCEQNDGGGECLTCAVAKTLQVSHQKSGDAIKPFYVYSKLGLICRTMVQGHQEDAHEFLRYLLEGMEKAYLARHKATKLDSYSKETTPINQIFGGYIRTEVKCLQCRHVSTTFQHFQDLLLDIRKAGTLDEALAGYFSQEQLDNNDYKCEACKRRVPATKQFILERPPKVLCVQLKRFSVLGGKISRHIGFKTTIDMGAYVRRKPGDISPKLVYRLASMVTHMGPSVNCGHYTAIAQVSTGKFYSFDDSQVRMVNLNHVMSTNAYIMIFEMEPSSTSSCLQLQGGSSQLAGSKSDGPKSQLTSTFAQFNGLADSSGASTSSGAGNASSSKGSPSSSNRTNGTIGQLRDPAESQPTPPLPPPPPLMSTHSSMQSPQPKRSFIGPQLPPGMDRSKLQELEKSSTCSNGGKLVDYEAESSDEDYDAPVVKPYINGSNSRNYKDKVTSNGFNNSNHYSANKINGNRRTPTPPRITSNGEASSSRTLQRNSSSFSSRPTSPNNNNRKRHHLKQDQRTDMNERKGYIKTSSVNKGWHVCKDSPSPSSSYVATNDWSVSDNIMSNESESNRSNGHSAAPNAADMRSFNGTNRSDTTSQLMKRSQWGYGNNNVSSWNGGKARLDRDVESQRHQDRMKHIYDNEEDEMDRGRQKKIKNYDNYNNYKFNYNHFQEHHNNKWQNNYPRNGYHGHRSNKGHPYQKSSYNNRSHHQRYQNHSRPRNDYR